MQANRSKCICLVRILKLCFGIFFKLSNYKVYYYNINRQMQVNGNKSEKNFQIILFFSY